VCTHLDHAAVQVVRNVVRCTYGQVCPLRPDVNVALQMVSAGESGGTGRAHGTTEGVTLTRIPALAWDFVIGLPGFEPGTS
jgi:hypothetical protein